MKLRTAAIAALVLCAGAYGAEQPGDGGAEALLRQAAQRHAQTESYSGSYTVTATFTSETRNETEASRGLFRLERPNKLHGRFESIGDELVIVCDGDRCWLYNVTTAKYASHQAPPDLAQLFEAQPYVSSVLGMGRFTFGPFGPDPYAALTAGMERAELVEGSQGDTPDAHHVRLHVEQGSVDLWISKESLELRRVRVLPFRSLAQLKEMGMAPADAELTIEVTMKRSAEAAREFEPPFAFEPPPGARAASDLRDLFREDLVGKPMRDFRLPGLEEGTVWRLSEHRGKVIALEFWFAGCPPCRFSMPAMEEIYDDLEGRGFLLLAINRGEPREVAAAFLESVELDIPVAMDPQLEATAAYGVEEFPSLIIIGRDGIIRAVHRGYVPGQDVGIRAEIKKLLAEEPPTEPAG